jgi:hypothetical protein
MTTKGRARKGEMECMEMFALVHVRFRDSCSCLLPVLLLLTLAAPAMGETREPNPSASISPPPHTSQAVPTKLEPLVTGLYVNRKEQGTLNILAAGDEYWLPWTDFLTAVGLPPMPEARGNLTLETTIGTIRFDADRLREVDGVRYLSFTQIKNHFGVYPSFNQSLFAVMLRVPWTIGAAEQTIGKELLKPDIEGPDFSVSLIHAEQTLSSNFKDIDTPLPNFQFGGSGLSGVWAIDAERDWDNQYEPSRYHWTKVNRQSAIRMGTGRSEGMPLVSSQEFTGVQLGWSNDDIFPYFDRASSFSQDSFMHSGSSQFRTVEGKGPPAGIAELRVDGRPVARQPVRMDGTFRFDNVQMGADFRKTEVLLYERSILEQPVSVLDYSQSIAGRALEPGKLLINGGGGIAGNALTDTYAEQSNSVAFGQLNYGVTNWLTTELAVRNGDAGNGGDLLAGTIFSTPSAWNASLYAAQSNDRYAEELRLERNTPETRLSLAGTLFDQGFQTDSQPRTQRHLLNGSYRPWDFATLSLLGIHEEGGDEDDDNASFIRPGVSLTPLRGLRMGIMPQYEDDDPYQYEIGYYRHSLNGEMRYSEKWINASASWMFSDTMNFRLSNQFDNESGLNRISGYWDWYPTSERNSIVQMVVSEESGQAGFSLSFHRAATAGFDFSINYRYNMPDVLDLDITGGSDDKENHHFLSCTLSWDFGWTGKRFTAVNRNSLSSTRGGIAGSAAPEDGGEDFTASLRKAGVLINGRKVAQDQQDNSYFVGNLKPGLYQVTLDPTDLPAELNADKKGRIVEVRSGAVTNVDIPVYAEYGIAGQVTGADGNGVAGVMVRVRREGSKEIVAGETTNMFGHYRVDGLRKGTYVVGLETDADGKLEVVDQRQIALRDRYEFDVDLRMVQ